MDNMCNNDYFNLDCWNSPYPVNYNPNISHEPCYRNDSYSSSEDSCLSMSVDNRMDTFFSPSEGFSKGNMQANIYKPYKLTNPNLPVAYSERQRMLLEVQKFHFALWDLNLYLNTHPMDKNVMMLFDQYRNSYKKSKREYENKYGAISVEDTNINREYWAWNKSPWPWEGE